MAQRVIDDVDAFLAFLSTQPLIQAAKNKELGLPPPPYVPLGKQQAHQNSDDDNDLLAALQDMA
jgi:hypothetical protein